MTIEQHVTSRELSEALKDAGAEQGPAVAAWVYAELVVYQTTNPTLAVSYASRAFLLSELLEMMGANFDELYHHPRNQCGPERDYPAQWAAIGLPGECFSSTPIEAAAKLLISLL